MSNGPPHDADEACPAFGDEVFQGFGLYPPRPPRPPAAPGMYIGVDQGVNCPLDASRPVWDVGPEPAPAVAALNAAPDGRTPPA